MNKFIKIIINLNLNLRKVDALKTAFNLQKDI